MKFIELYAKNPFKYKDREKVMGYNSFPFQFICGEIVEREHRGEANYYKIESEYGKEFSGNLIEECIKPYDEKLVLDEKRRTIGDDKTRVLRVKIIFDFDTTLLVEENGKEVIREEIEGDNIEPESLIKSYEKLLVFLGFTPDIERMFLGDGLLVLNFIKSKE